MPLPTWLYFLWVSIVLALSPGPAVLFVVSHGLRSGVGASVLATLGVLAANSFYFALSGLGLSAVLLGAPAVFAVLKWLGVAYLTWLGSKALASAGGALRADAAASALRGRQVLRAGFLLQAANPKALVFFASILPSFVHTGAAAWPIGWQILVLGITSTVSEFFVLLCYGYLAEAASRRFRDPRFARWLDRASGLLLLGVAVWVALR
jgi:homoserine/homoserine lactone efflux protein